MKEAKVISKKKKNFKPKESPKRTRVSERLQERWRKQYLKDQEDAACLARLIEEHYEKNPPKAESPPKEVDLEELSKWCAKRAINYYNKKNKGAGIHLVEAKEADTICEGVFTYYHLNFIAKAKTSADSSPKLFFAEIKDGPKRVRVTLCCTVEPGDPRTDGCGYCDPDYEPKIYHPVDGYEAGYGFPYRPNMEFIIWK